MNARTKLLLKIQEETSIRKLAQLAETGESEVDPSMADSMAANILGQILEENLQEIGKIKPE